MSRTAGDLRQALDFEAADLAANRIGSLSQAQADRLRRDRRRTALMTAAAFWLLALLAAGLFYWGQAAPNAIGSLAGIGLTLVNALLVGYAGRSFMRLGADLRADGVLALTGPVERVLRRGQRGDSALLRIAGTELPVTKEVFLGFRHEARYRVYLARESRIMLSAEALDCDDPAEGLRQE